MSTMTARPQVTRWLAERATQIEYDDLPPDAIVLARQCILDWFGVTIAGAAEPAVRMLRDVALADEAAPVATLLGWAQRSSVTNAALINGTASHALDFDDVNMAILGHPTVAVLRLSAPAIIRTAFTPQRQWAASARRRPARGYCSLMQRAPPRLTGSPRPWLRG